MKKKHHHRPTRRAHRPRNAATGFAAAAPRPRARPAAKQSTAPHWKTILAAVAGGAGSAAIGGLVVNQKILSAQTVGLGLMLGGGATAYFSEGLPRVVGSSIAASGAGQFALSIINKRAVGAQDDDSKGKSDANKDSAHATNPAPAALPPPAVAPRQRATGGGVVVDLFRDAANDLDTIEDEWRYGIRDDAQPSAPESEPVVIDLDEVA